MRVIDTIERVGTLSRQEFEESFARRNHPVIISGALEGWPARSNWSTPALRKRIGPVPTRFKVGPAHRHPDFSASNPAEMFATKTGTFTELLDRLSGPKEQARRVLLTGEEEWLVKRREGQPDAINDKLKVLLEDFELPDLFPEERLYSVWFWLSAAGVRTWLHYDNNDCHNLNAQVHGHKQVWLFSPDQLGKLYPFGLNGDLPAYNCSQVDVEAPESQRFPEFAGAEAVTGEVKSGDLLFIPANWIHTFLHVGSYNANVNFWWKPETLAHNPVSARQALLNAVNALGGVQALNSHERRALRQVELQLLSRVDSEASVSES